MMETLVELVARHPLAATMESVRSTVPDAPAVYEMDCEVVLPWMVPLEPPKL